MKPKIQRFVDEYLLDRKGAEAARRAGYSEKGARQRAYILLHRPDVLAAIDERQVELRRQLGMQVDEMVVRLSTIARDSTSAGVWPQLRAIAMLMRHLGVDAPPKPPRPVKPPPPPKQRHWYDPMTPEEKAAEDARRAADAQRRAAEAEAKAAFLETCKPASDRPSAAPVIVNVPAGSPGCLPSAPAPSAGLASPPPGAPAPPPRASPRRRSSPSFTPAGVARPITPVRRRRMLPPVIPGGKQPPWDNNRLIAANLAARARHAWLERRNRPYTGHPDDEDWDD